MPRLALVPLLACALLTAPALAMPPQGTRGHLIEGSQGAPTMRTEKPRAMPGTGATPIVPSKGRQGGHRQSSDTREPGHPGNKITMGTGPMRGGGGPLGQHGLVVPQQAQTSK